MHRDIATNLIPNDLSFFHSSVTTVQTEINLFGIVCKKPARGLQLTCKSLAKDQANEAMQAFKSSVS